MLFDFPILASELKFAITLSEDFEVGRRGDRPE